MVGGGGVNQFQWQHSSAVPVELSYWLLDFSLLMLGFRPGVDWLWGDLKAFPWVDADIICLGFHFKYI